FAPSFPTHPLPSACSRCGRLKSRRGLPLSIQGGIMPFRCGGLLLAACFCVGPPAVYAQEPGNTAAGSRPGTAPQAAVGPGAAGPARDVDTNIVPDAVTDQDGRFRFPYLKVGRYEIKVHLEGFADATRPLTLTIGSAFELPITLALAGVDTSVTVT